MIELFNTLQRRLGRLELQSVTHVQLTFAVPGWGKRFTFVNSVHGPTAFEIVGDDFSTDRKYSDWILAVAQGKVRDAEGNMVAA